MPKYVMTMTINDVYQKFIDEHQHIKISFNTFRILKPETVSGVSETNRKTCLCQICCNYALKFDALTKEKIGTNFTKQSLSDLTLCPYATLQHGKCLRRECQKCKADISSYFEQEIADHSGTKLTWSKWEYLTLSY